MNSTWRNGVLALAFLAGAALLASEASAGTLQRYGYFGGSWAPIGPRDNRYVRRFYRHYGPGFYAHGTPVYGPRYGYYAPRDYYGPPSVGIGVGIGF